MAILDTTGIRIRKNPKNRWTIFELHYSADPVKRNSDWIDLVKASMSKSQWDREYELHWRTYSGTKVFEDFDRKLHVNETNEDPYPGVPLLIGVDFGLTPACVISQYAGLRLTILDEIVEQNMPASEFAKCMSHRLQLHFPQMEHITIVDPAGFDRCQVDARRCVDELSANGFSPQPGLQGLIERKESVVRLLTTTYRGEARLRINPRCNWLVSGLEGGYRYKQPREGAEESDKILKNEFSHVCDAMQYVCTRLNDLTEDRETVHIRPPKYGFQAR